MASFTRSVPLIDRSDRGRQFRRRRSGFIAAFGSILVGYDTGIIAGAILFIQPEFHLSLLEEGLIITSILIGAIFGSAISGWIGNALGRKRTLMATAVIFAIASVLMACAPTYLILLLGRFIAGLAVGAMEATVPTFLSELAPTKSRGRFGTNNQLMIAIGILIAGITNLFFSEHLSWRFSLGIAIIPALILLVALFSQPETPRWLMMRGRAVEAKSVLESLYTPDEAARAFAELQRVESAGGVQLPVSGEAVVAAAHGGALGVGALVRSPILRGVLFVGIFFAMLQQFIGINSIVYYAPTILKTVGFATDAALVNVVGFGILSVIMTLISGAIVDRVGRKPLLVIGALVLSLAMLCVGSVFVFGLLGSVVGQVLALVGLAVFKAGFSLTWGPVVWVVLPELFPLRARSAGVSVATSFKLLVEMLSTLFLALLLASAASVMFIIFAVFGIVASIFVAKKIPETGGRSLEQLETDSQPVRTGVDLAGTVL